MALSTLQTLFRSPPHHTLHLLNPKPHTQSITPIKASSSSSNSNSNSNLNSCINSNPNGNSKSKRPLLDVGIGLLAASMVFLSPFEANATRIEYYATVAEPECELQFVPSGLGYCDLAVGTGEKVPYNQLINIHYTARFADGIVFDSSYKRGRPLTMRLGMGKVISGLDQGILGGEGVPPMYVGGKRKLKIPPLLAYGPEPAGCFSGDCNIPANATLLYDINFVNIYSGNRSR